MHHATGDRAARPELAGRDGDESDHHVATHLVRQRPQRAVDETALGRDAVRRVVDENVEDAVRERHRQGGPSSHVGEWAFRAKREESADLVMPLDPADQCDDERADEDGDPQGRHDAGHTCLGELARWTVDGTPADQQPAEGEEGPDREPTEREHLGRERRQRLVAEPAERPRVADQYEECEDEANDVEACRAGFEEVVERQRAA